MAMTELNDIVSIICMITILLICIISISIAIIRWYYFPKQSKNTTVIGFFHPNCASGGGGERVLWKIIQAINDLIEKHNMYIDIVIYTIDKPSASYLKELVDHVSSRFSISIPANSIQLIHINGDGMDVVTNGKRSMIVQTIDTLKLCWKGLTQLRPDVYIDTTGCAFTFVIARVIAGCKVAAYVHYPTISTDMLALVWKRRPLYNNNAKITSSALYSYIKLVYYTLFAICYGLVGSLASLIMVNSTWTYNHIHYLWRFTTNPIHVLYPPCDTQDLSKLSIDTKDNAIIISIGQFRPEKDHELQIRSFALLLKMLQNDDTIKVNPKLILIGSCRSKIDQDRVQYLQNYAKQYNVSNNNIEFITNQPYSVLKSYLGKATIGLHTMWNEHFGISVVEMMAAGLITIAHDSGGPKSDIIRNGKTGFLATTEEQYARCMKDVLYNEMYDRDVNMDIRCNARKSASRFSDQVFDESFKEILLSSGILKK